MRKRLSPKINMALREMNFNILYDALLQNGFDREIHLSAETERAKEQIRLAPKKCIRGKRG